MTNSAMCLHGHITKQKSDQFATEKIRSGREKIRYTMLFEQCSLIIPVLLNRTRLIKRLIKSTKKNNKSESQHQVYREKHRLVHINLFPPLLSNQESEIISFKR